MSTIAAAICLQQFLARPKPMHSPATRVVGSDDRGKAAHRVGIFPEETKRRSMNEVEEPVVVVVRRQAGGRPSRWIIVASFGEA
jgi:hypothetical protein